MTGRPGFTLIEATIGGGILLIGILLMAALTKNMLDLSQQGGVAPLRDNSVQDGAVVEQYLRTTVAAIRASVAAVSPPPTSNQDVTSSLGIPDLQLGSSYLYVRVTQLTQIKNSGATIYLVPYDVVVLETAPNTTSHVATDRVLAHTVFWEFCDGSGSKKGI
jgi:hypothetical protein